MHASPDESMQMVHLTCEQDRGQERTSVNFRGKVSSCLVMGQGRNVPLVLHVPGAQKRSSQSARKRDDFADKDLSVEYDPIFLFKYIDP